MATGSTLNGDAAHLRNLQSLSDLLVKPVTATRFNEWKTHLGDVFAIKGTVFGSIRWAKTMRPLITQNHADAFTLVLTHTQDILVGTIGGEARWETVIAPNNPPSKWSGPDDDQYYRVSFLSSGLDPEKAYTLQVSFSSQARWASTGMLRLHHVIEPASRVFKPRDISMLEPFDVTAHLFSL